MRPKPQIKNSIAIKKSLFGLRRLRHTRLVVAIHRGSGILHTAVVLNCPVLDGLPHLLVVPWLVLVHLHPLALEADLGGWGSGASAGGAGEALALRVEDGVGLIHLLVVLLDGFPRLGDVALRLLRDLGGGGGLAGGSGGAGLRHAWGVGCLVGGVEALVVGLCVSGDVGEDVGWHCGL